MGLVTVVRITWVGGMGALHRPLGVQIATGQGEGIANACHVARPARSVWIIGVMRRALRTRLGSVMSQIQMGLRGGTITIKRMTIATLKRIRVRTATSMQSTRWDAGGQIPESVSPVRMAWPMGNSGRPKGVVIRLTAPFQGRVITFTARVVLPRTPPLRNVQILSRTRA